MPEPLLSHAAAAKLHECIDQAFYRIGRQGGLHFKDFELVDFDESYQEYEDGYERASRLWRTAMHKMVERRSVPHHPALTFTYQVECFCRWKYITLVIHEGDGIGLGVTPIAPCPNCGQRTVHSYHSLDRYR